MGKPSAPTPPDPVATAGAQTGTNVSTAIANSLLGAVNQNTPYGSLTYDIQGWQNPTQAPATTQPTTQPAPQTPSTGGAPVDSGAGGGSWMDMGGGGGRMTPAQLQAAQSGKPPVDPTIASEAPMSYNDPSAGGGYQITDPTTGTTYTIPQITANIELSPEQQAILDANQAAQTNLANTAVDRSEFLQQYLSQGMDTGSLTPYANSPLQTSNFVNPEAAGDITQSYGTDWSQDRQRVEDALMSRLDPRIEQDRQALQSRLANQGITPGSEAYNREMQALEQNIADQRTSVLLGAGQEQSRLAQLAQQQAQFQNSAQAQQFGQNTTLANMTNANQSTLFNQQLAQAQQQNAQHGQELQEMLALRNQPINEITALLSGSQVTNPSVSVAQPSSIPTVDYAGLVNQNYAQQQASYQQQNANSQGILGGLFGLGSSAITGGLFG